jgi:hypothetical protein
MKRIKVLGLCLLASLAASIAVASPAWAKELVLSTKGGPLTSGAELKATSKNTVFTTSAGNIECSSVVITGSLSNNSASKLSATLTEATLTGGEPGGLCKTSTAFGPALVTAAGLPWSASFTTKGAVQVKGAPVRILFNFSGSGVMCGYETKTLKGTANINGEPIAISFVKQVLKGAKTNNKLCPKAAEASGEQALTSKGEAVVAEVWPQPKENAKTFEVTDRVHLASGKLWSAFGSPPKWWVAGALLVGAEPIAEETKVTNPLTLEFTLKAKEVVAAKITCATEKIKNGMIEAGSRTEEAEVFEGCEVVGQPNCAVSNRFGTPGTITTDALKATLTAGTPEKLKFAPESGKTIAAFEIKEVSATCAEANFVFRANGEMICDYTAVETENLEHPLEFKAGESKVQVEGKGI